MSNGYSRNSRRRRRDCTNDDESSTSRSGIEESGIVPQLPHARSDTAGLLAHRAETFAYRFVNDYLQQTGDYAGLHSIVVSAEGALDTDTAVKRIAEKLGL